MIRSANIRGPKSQFSHAGECISIHKLAAVSGNGRASTSLVTMFTRWLLIALLDRADTSVEILLSAQKWLLTC